MSRRSRRPHMHSPVLLLAVLIEPASGSGRLCFTGSIPQTAGAVAAAHWGPGSGYDKGTRPGLAAALAANETRAAQETLQLSFRVENLLNVGTRSGTITVQVLEKWYWRDQRLAFTPYADGGCFENDIIYYEGPPSGLWKPDRTFTNMVKRENEHDYYRLYADGRVLWQAKSSLTFTCDMDFKLMPFDTQRCMTRVILFRGNELTEMLTWRDPARPVLGPDGRNIGGDKEWELVGLTGEIFNHSAVGEDDTGLDIHVYIKRDGSYWVWYVTIPACMIVMISYSSMYIGRHSAPARAGVATVTVLVLYNLINGVRASLPAARDTHNVLLDFLFVCMCFCFYSAIEYAAVNFLKRVEPHAETALEAKTAAREVERAESSATGDTVGTQADVAKGRRAERGARKCARLLVRADGTMRVKDAHIEIGSRWIYPIVFIICTVFVFTRPDDRFVNPGMPGAKADTSV